MKQFLYVAFDKVANSPSLAAGILNASTDGQVVRDNTGRLLQFKAVPFDTDLEYLCIGEFDTETLALTGYDEYRHVPLDSYKFPEVKAVKEAPSQASVDEFASQGKSSS